MENQTKPARSDLGLIPFAPDFFRDKVHPCINQKQSELNLTKLWQSNDSGYVNMAIFSAAGYHILACNRGFCCSTCLPSNLPCKLIAMTVKQVVW